MDSTDCFLEILSAYQSSDSGCQVSLLEYCHRFGVDYYKFLGWYRHYKCQLTNPTSPSGMQLTDRINKSHTMSAYSTFDSIIT